MKYNYSIPEAVKITLEEIKELRKIKYKYNTHLNLPELAKNKPLIIKLMLNLLDFIISLIFTILLPISYPFYYLYLNIKEKRIKEHNDRVYENIRKSNELQLELNKHFRKVKLNAIKEFLDSYTNDDLKNYLKILNCNYDKFIRENNYELIGLHSHKENIIMAMSNKDYKSFMFEPDKSLKIILMDNNTDYSSGYLKTGCYSCKTKLYSNDKICNKCKGIICPNCGACLCKYDEYNYYSNKDYWDWI